MDWQMDWGFHARRAALALLACAAVGGSAALAAGVPAPASANTPAPVQAKLGVTAEALDPAIAGRMQIPPATRGLVVTSLAFKGAAATAGVRIGDIIQALDGRPLDGPKGLKALADHQGPAQLTVLRAGVTSIVPVG